MRNCLNLRRAEEGGFTKILFTQGRSYYEHNIKLHCYAEDTQIYNSGPPLDFPVLIEKVKNNHLKIKNKKSQCILITRNVTLLCKMGVYVIPFLPLVNNFGIHFNCMVMSTKFVILIT